jgi:hypothetical protein
LKRASRSPAAKSALQRTLADGPCVDSVDALANQCMDKIVEYIDAILLAAGPEPSNGDRRKIETAETILKIAIEEANAAIANSETNRLIIAEPAPMTPAGQRQALLLAERRLENWHRTLTSLQILLREIGPGGSTVPQ